MIALKEYDWFKRLGFYRKRESIYGDSFVSIEEVLVERNPYGHLFGYNTSNSESTIMLKPRFIYTLSTGNVYDNLTKNQSLVNSMEEFVDFLQGNINKQTRQLDWNKKKFGQGLSSSADEYWSYFMQREPNRVLHIRDPRRTTMYTGREGMRQLDYLVGDDLNRRSRPDINNGYFTWEVPDPIEHPVIEEMPEPNREGYDRIVAMRQALELRREMLEVTRQANRIDEQARN